jgi:hypothetical protein
MTIADDRFKRGSCPSWCQTRHADWDLEPGGHDGPRWSTVRTDDGSSVDIATVQNEDGDVVVWVDAEHGSMLTSEQARAAAHELLEAASWVDDHRSPWVDDHRSPWVDDHRSPDPEAADLTPALAPSAPRPVM